VHYTSLYRDAITARLTSGLTTVPGRCNRMSRTSHQLAPGSLVLCRVLAALSYSRAASLESPRLWLCNKVGRRFHAPTVENTICVSFGFPPICKDCPKYWFDRFIDRNCGRNRLFDRIDHLALVLPFLFPGFCHLMFLLFVSRGWVDSNHALALAWSPVRDGRLFTAHKRQKPRRVANRAGLGN
jgi:hypothetical protein